MASKGPGAAHLLVLGCLGHWLRAPAFAPGLGTRLRGAVAHSTARGPLLRAEGASDGNTVAVEGAATAAEGASEPGPSPSLAEEGMLVHVKYNLTLQNGAEVASGPLDFVCGEGLVLRGLDLGVQGMVVGETRELALEPEDAFGPVEPEKTVVLPASDLPPGCELGRQMQLDGPRGEKLYATVVTLDAASATLDYNHPLAGMPLALWVELVGVEPAPDRSELIVETISPGDGQTYPTPGCRVSVHYEGRLADGSMSFDSTREHGQPFTFEVGVGQVIRGWDEGIVAMTVGERALLRVPAELGYGEDGFGDLIPPNADLVFDVELLSVE